MGAMEPLGHGAIGPWGHVEAPNRVERAKRYGVLESHLIGSSLWGHGAMGRRHGCASLDWVWWGNGTIEGH